MNWIWTFCELESTSLELALTWTRKRWTWPQPVVVEYWNCVSSLESPRFKNKEDIVEANVFNFFKYWSICTFTLYYMCIRGSLKPVQADTLSHQQYYVRTSFNISPTRYQVLGFVSLPLPFMCHWSSFYPFKLRFSLDLIPIQLFKRAFETIGPTIITLPPYQYLFKGWVSSSTF